MRSTPYHFLRSASDFGKNACAAWLLPIIATTVLAIVAGGFKFYISAEQFHATYEDDSLYQQENDDERDSRLEWLRDRMNELRIEHGLPLEGWPE